jgi:dGTPase
VCHDFEDAVDAGVVTHADLPDLVRKRCGVTRREQLSAFITGMIQATAHTGRIGMTPDAAEALALFRRFNYDAIYHRAASRAQAHSVIDMLRPLVEHYIAFPQLLPAFDVNPFDAHTTTAAHEAVTYVGGMTDRFACKQAVQLLHFPTHKLPQGIDTLLAAE